MKIKPVQMILPLKFPKKKAVQMTFRFNANGKPPIPKQPEPKPSTKPSGKGKRVDLFM